MADLTPYQPQDIDSHAELKEEAWEEANCSVAAYTPHSSQRLHFFAPLKDACAYIDIESVDTSSMSLLDVCNYTVEEEDVDGSGHCVWMGALFFIHAVSVCWGAANRDCNPSSSSWYSDAYFQNRSVSEMGCGTGAAGIALLNILSSQGKTAPKHLTFLDNDPEALELCRKNCQRNRIDESLYDIQLQQPWTDLSLSVASEEKPSEGFSFETILATDVLYDLKIIRPFLQTASRFLTRSDTTSRKHLILSHVPRWFLPRDVTKNISEPYSAARILEQHIVTEASQFGFQLIRTVRPYEVMAQFEGLTQHCNHEVEPELLEALQGMEDASAVLWVFELTTHT